MKASCQIKFQVSAYLRGTFLVQFFFFTNYTEQKEYLQLRSEKGSPEHELQTRL